jgi:hypothetical protein
LRRRWAWLGLPACLLAGATLFEPEAGSRPGELDYAKTIENACIRIVEPSRPSFFERTEVLCYAARAGCARWSGALVGEDENEARCAVKVYRKRGQVAAMMRWYLSAGGDAFETDRFCFRPDGSLAAHKAGVTLFERVQINMRAYFDAQGRDLARSEHHFDVDTGEPAKRRKQKGVPRLPVYMSESDVRRDMTAAGEREADLADSDTLSVYESIASELSSQTARRLVEDRAQRVLELVKAKDFRGLAQFVHPLDGVRFSPEATVDHDRDLVLTAGQVATLDDDHARHLWNASEEEGDVVVETDFQSYYERFIYDHDFANAPQYGYNCSIGGGNTANNTRAVYPQAIVAEFHFPGIDPRSWGQDWSSLRLAFAQYERGWYLIGIIHDHWTL